jgi:signal transduction histidine kinase
VNLFGQLPKLRQPLDHRAPGNAQLPGDLSLLEDAPDAVDTIQEAADRIVRIHSDLKAFIRGEVQEVGLADLNAGIRTTVAMMRRNLPTHVTLSTNLGELPLVRCRPGPLNQVFFNLLKNALDSVGNEGEIRVATRVVDGDIEVVVEDNGVGLPAEIREHVFEPFFTTKEIGKGTGLGLAVCYQVMEQHGGSIRLDMSYKSGARFVLTLPTRQAEKESRS